MKNIYQESLRMIAHGATFHVDLPNKSLRVGGKSVIKDGKYEGELGASLLLPATNSEQALENIKHLFEKYRHSVPSERSDSKRRLYFRALPVDGLCDEDMAYGAPREFAQAELEIYLLCVILDGTLVWDDFAKDKWFWQSGDLVLLKKWITNN